jgi:hypothetical protein
VSRFADSLVGKDVYVKLEKDWSVQGRLARIEDAGLVIERLGVPPVFVSLSRIGTLEEAQGLDLPVPPDSGVSGGAPGGMRGR